MESPQHSLATLAQAPRYAGEVLCNPIDEDVALGCECADPALQIDCWGEEAAKAAQRLD